MMSEMSEPNITLRMLYITVVVVALFITCGLIRTIHDHGLPEIAYPFHEGHGDLTDQANVRKRRDLKPSLSKTRHIPKHYRLPKDTVLDNLSDLTLSKVFWFYINTMQALCNNVTAMSSTGNWHKICTDDLLLSPEHSCLVYSVGHDSSFDFEILLKKTYHCEVHIFQQESKTRARESLPVLNGTNKRPDGIMVHEVLGAETDEITNVTAAIEKTVPNEHRVIDVLKIAVNGEEWNVLSALLNLGLLKSVRQLLVEIHFGWGGVSKIEALKILRNLYAVGFRIAVCNHILSQKSISYMPNLTITNVNELSLINTRLNNYDRDF